MPAEFAPQDWLWICFPHDASLWLEALVPAQEQMAVFANVVAESGQQVRLIVRDAANEMRARQLVHADVVIERHPYGDIWVRDSGPLVLLDGEGGRIARRFRFNGWGDKYRLDGDQEIGDSMARTAGLPIDHTDWVLEGGAIDTDGTGLVVTTEQCLLNPNRNPQLTRAEIEQRLRSDLGFDRILWLGEGLAADHTDGHVDNLARFVVPGTLAIPVASGADDPNAAIYADARARATAFGLTVVDVPSPGLVTMGDELVPASYMNFVICNSVVVVPTYDTMHDDAAVAAIAALFPDHATFGLPSDAVLTGGGSFHCSSQHAPALR
jgi:agmatine deiminase